MRCCDPRAAPPKRDRYPRYALLLGFLLVWPGVVLPAGDGRPLSPRPSVAGGAAGLLEPAAVLRFSQGAVGRRVPDVVLRDAEGVPFRLSDLKGKPLLVNFLYTGCFQVCPTGVRTLKAAVEAARDALGSERFHVVSIGFNVPADTPDAMASFARAQGVRTPGWRFAAVDETARDALVEAFGFSYAWTPKGIDHVAQVTVVDADGRIYRQVYGDTFPLPALVEPLRQLLTGRAEQASGLPGWLDRVRLLCTIYDPASGRYRLRYSLLFELAGGLLGLGAMAAYYVHELRRTRAAERSRSA